MLILRANASGLGRVRLECNENDTLDSLKKQIAAKLNVKEWDRIAISLDEMGCKNLMRNGVTLSQYGLRSGTDLFIRVPGDVNPTIPAQMHKSTSQVSLTSSSQVSRKRKGKTEKNYKSFEWFLSEKDYDVIDLPLTKSFAPVPKQIGGGPTQLPPTITLKHQPYRHVDHVEIVNVPDLTRFVQNWQVELETLQQRAAYLIGYYVDDSHFGTGGTRAVVEGLWEPAQVSLADSVEILNDDNLRCVEGIAKALDLEVVGWVFTHLPRSKLITASEIIRMGQLQLSRLHHSKHYTGYPISTFVTLTIAAKDELGGVPGPDAFMVSDLGLSMIRDGLLDTKHDVQDDYLRLRPASSQELLPTVLEGGKTVVDIDCDWFLVRLVESAPKKPISMFKRRDFPVGDHPSFSDVRVRRLFNLDITRHSYPMEKDVDGRMWQIYISSYSLQKHSA